MAFLWNLSVPREKNSVWKFPPRIQTLVAASLVIWSAAFGPYQNGFIDRVPEIVQFSSDYRCPQMSRGTALDLFPAGRTRTAGVQTGVPLLEVLLWGDC